jgi:hypothetical protein
MDVKLYPIGRKFDIFNYGNIETSGSNFIFNKLQVSTFSIILEALFRQISIFLNFNLFATIGSYLANFIQWVPFR